MNKISLALAMVGALASAPTSALAGTIQTLQTPELSSAHFTSLFQPIEGVDALSMDFQFKDAPTSGTIRSQVFQGTGDAQGLYAYTYQLGVNDVAYGSGDPVHVDSISYQFDDTPVGTDFLRTGTPSYAYAIKNGSIGTLPANPQVDGAPRAPYALSWQPGTNSGVLRAQYVDPITGVPPLGAGTESATYVVISKQPFKTQFVNFQSTNPTTGEFASVYAATGGKISPIPVPEPAAALAWAGMAAAAGLVARARRDRARASA